MLSELDSSYVRLLVKFAETIFDELRDSLASGDRSMLWMWRSIPSSYFVPVMDDGLVVIHFF